MTIPSRPTRRPDDTTFEPPPPPTAQRVTVMAGKALSGTGEHRIAEWSFAALGLVLVASGVGLFYVMRKDAPTNIAAGIIVAGLLLVPGVAPQLAKGIKLAGGSLAGVWKARQ